MKTGDHVAHDHKGHRSYGIIEAFCTGLFGEPRARLEWIGSHGSPFSVCVEDLSPDSAGVVSGILAAKGPILMNRHTIPTRVEQAQHRTQSH